MKRYANVVAIAALNAIAWTTISIADSASEDFNEAIRLDLDGKTQLALSSYIRAANAGLSQAQFNVAVMLDSGRGAPRNMRQAALWYARAAAHGNKRAAYNMGQLFASGDGVPRNPQLAKAWFAASGLPASSAHLADHTEDAHGDKGILVAPELIAPASQSKIAPELGGVVLVWVSKPQPVSVEYYIEVRMLETSHSQEVFSGRAKASSIFAELPQNKGIYAWRVSVVSNKTGIYMPSEWMRFSVLLQPGLAQSGGAPFAQ